MVFIIIWVGDLLASINETAKKLKRKWFFVEISVAVTTKSKFRFGEIQAWYEAKF